MPNNGVDLSVAQLKRVLLKRKTSLAKLDRRKNKLERELTKVEAQMAAISGGRNAGSRLARKRPKNEKSLREIVVVLLGKTKQGYSMSALVEKILATGYKSSSVDFKNVVYQCLYNHDGIVHLPESGIYRLK